MTDVEEGKTPVESPQPEGDVTAPVPPAMPVPKSTEQKLEAKPEDDVKTMYANLEKELGRLKNDVGYYKQQAQHWYEQSQRDQRPPQAEPTVEFDYDHPLDSFEKWYARKEKDRTEKERQTLMSRAAMAHERGKQRAMKSSPKLIEGIEQDVEAAVYNFYAPYVQQGHDVSEQLSDPDTWEKAAQIIRLTRKEYDRIIPQKTTPVSASPTEIPSSVRPQEPTVDFDGETRELVKKLGLDEKKAREVIEGELAAEKKGYRRHAR